MKILHLNHRDSQHPRAGGLEEIVFEISRRWMIRGHEVEHLCAGFPGSLGRTKIMGMEVHRIGREEYFNFIAGPHLRSRSCYGADIVIEHLSKVACMTPWFIKDRPVMTHVPHVFQKAIFEETNVAMASYVYLMERMIPLAYRKVPFWALSESTASDLASMGVSRENIRVISGGVNTAFFDVATCPSVEPTVAYLGRIKKYKGLVQPLLESWKVVLAKIPQARLVIAGVGDYEGEVRAAIARHGIEKSVEMPGYLDHERKRELLKKSWMVAYPSAKEGWGLSVIEAGAMGIPTIASNSPGLREAVRDNETGILVPHGDVDALASGMIRLMEEQPLRQRLGLGAKGWSRQFDWDQMAEKILHYIQERFPWLKAL